MKRNLKRLCALILVVCMLPVFSVLAADWSNASEWAEAELNKASEAKLIPEALKDKDFTEQITRGEFAALAVSLYEAISGVEAVASENNPFTDTSDAEVLKAYELGIVNGMTETTFSGDLNLERQQAATMLTRTMTAAINGLQIITEGAPTFADAEDVSEWANESVLYMARRKIIGGFPDNTFKPRNNTTRQEAVILALRSLEASKVPDNIGIEIN